MRFNHQHFRDVGMTIIQNGKFDGSYTHDDERSFRAIYGVHWGVAAEVWHLLEQHSPNIYRQPKHLFWALMFLKLYNREKSHCLMLQKTATEKKMGLDYS